MISPSCTAAAADTLTITNNTNDAARRPGLRTTVAALAVSGLSLSMLLAAPAAEAQQYTLTELQAIGSSFDDAFVAGMNEVGEVAGSSFDFNDVLQPVLWAPDGTPTVLPAFSEFGGTPRGLNDNGWVVGTGFVGDGDIRDDGRAILWRNGGVENLGVPAGATATEGEAVNDSGTVVGRAWYLEGNTRTYKAVAWTSRGGWRVLEGLSDRSSQARDINDAGDIIGISIDDQGRLRDVLWENGTGTPIDLGDVFELMWGIGDNGVIVGQFRNASNAPEAVIWENGVVTELGFLGNGLFGGPASSAWAVNSSNQVVGRSTGRLSSTAPFLWKDGVMIDLEHLHDGEFELMLEARDINDAGEVLVIGLSNGRDRGFILREIPHPIGLSDPNPGIAGQQNTLSAKGVTPFGVCYFVAGFETGDEFSGQAQVPGCGDLFVNIRNPIILGTDVADAFGLAELTASAPSGLAGGQVLLMAVEPQACAISNLVTWRFPE
ncbi:MAG: hypothetical protein ACOC0P_02965 [Planctomycetota bacterium]